MWGVTDAHEKLRQVLHRHESRAPSRWREPRVHRQAAARSAHCPDVTFSCSKNQLDTCSVQAVLLSEPIPSVLLQHVCNVAAVELTPRGLPQIVNVHLQRVLHVLLRERRHHRIEALHAHSPRMRHVAIPECH